MSFYVQFNFISKSHIYQRQPSRVISKSQKKIYMKVVFVKDDFHVLKSSQSETFFFFFFFFFLELDVVFRKDNF
jgi:hypothetical protein